MAENNKFIGNAAHRQNLVASMKWASLLMSQVPKNAAPHGIAVIELTLISHLLLKRDIALLDESHQDQEIDVSMMLRSVCARLGYRLFPDNIPIEYYEVEICQSCDHTFKTIVSCPNNISLGSYVSMLFNRDGEVDQNHRVIRKFNPEEATNRIAQILENRKERVSAAATTMDSFMSVSKLATTTEVSPEEREIVEVAQKSGLLDIYGEVVDRRNKELGQGTPTDLATNFLSFLRNVTEMKLPRVHLDRFVKEFGGWIKVYKAQGISMVLSDNHIKMFLPSSSFNLYLNQLNTPLNLHGVTMARNNQKGEALSSLMKRRGGYVPASCDIFTEALLHAAGGSFGREMRPIPIKK